MNFFIGISLVGSYRFEESLKYLDKALQLLPNPEVYLIRATAFLGLNQPSKSLEDINIALADNPENARLRLIQGMSLVNLYRYEDALVSLNTASQLDPNLEDVHFYKGEAYIKMGQIPSAIK
jgi:tetratricopeptide (TPR) repeat protein